MNQAELLELARAGDTIAIATLINHSLEPKGITARVSLQDQCLQVMLEAKTVPDQARLSQFIHRGLVSLKSPLINTVKLYARQVGQKLPDWTETFTLTAGPTLVTTFTPPATAPQPELETPAQPAPQPVAEISANSAPQSQALSLKERARQGDVEALTTLLNRAVSGKGVNLALSLEGSFLQVELESRQTPDEGLVNVLVHRELSNLRSPLIKTVRLTGRPTDATAPAWSQDLKAKPIGDGSLYIQYIPADQSEDEDSSSHGAAPAKTKPSSKLPGHVASGQFRDKPGRSAPTQRPAAGQRDLVLERKILSCLCHGSLYVSFGFVSVIVPVLLLTTSQDPIVKANAKESLNLTITAVIVGVCIALLLLPTILLPPLMLILLILGVVFVIYLLVMPAVAMIRCWTNPDEEFRYPWIWHILG